MVALFRILLHDVSFYIFTHHFFHFFGTRLRACLRVLPLVFMLSAERVDNRGVTEQVGAPFLSFHRLIYQTAWNGRTDRFQRALNDSLRFSSIQPRTDPSHLSTISQ